jgi:hypothetical protein
MGFWAGCGNTTGTRNTFLGYYGGCGNTTGCLNTFIGYSAGQSNTTGSCNTFLGHCAGCGNTTGSNNFLAGYCAGVGTFGLINIGTESNRIVLGNCNTTNFYTKLGNDPGDSVNVKWKSTTYELAADVSSCRFKTNIRPFLGGLTDTLKMEPVRYNFTNNPTGRDQVGFIAEQLDEIALNEFVVYDQDHIPFSVSYDRITALLVNAVKDLKTELDSAKTEISQLKQRVDSLSPPQ